MRVQLVVDLGAALSCQGIVGLNLQLGLNMLVEARTKKLLTIEAYSNENKSTFLDRLMRHLLNDDRTVPARRNLSEEELNENMNWMLQEWDKRRSSLPTK